MHALAMPAGNSPGSSVKACKNSLVSNASCSRAVSVRIENRLVEDLVGLKIKQATIGNTPSKKPRHCSASSTRAITIAISDSGSSSSSGSITITRHSAALQGATTSSCVATKDNEQRATVKRAPIISEEPHPKTTKATEGYAQSLAGRCGSFVNFATPSIVSLRSLSARLLSTGTGVAILSFP